MKTCPTCRMTVNAHSECPMCKTELTDIPYSDRRGEVYKLNRWFWPYFIKTNRWSLASFALVVVKIICFGLTWNGYMLVTALFLLLMVLFALFPERWKGLGSWRFSEEYNELLSGNFAQGLLGFLTVISMLLWW